MPKGKVSGLAAVGVAAAIFLPFACDAQSTGNNTANEATNAETLSPAVSQATDRADARIAILKADLRLTPDQDRNWPRLQSALHDIAVKQAESWAESNGLQTGRASSSPGAAEAANRNKATVKNETKKEQAPESYPEQESRMAPSDAIDEMRNRADALQIEAADLRHVANAAEPLYDSLNDRQRHRLVQFVYEEIKGDRMNWHGRRF